LETWLEVDLHAPFAGRILPIDSAVADRSGVIIGEARRAGKSIPVIDGLLAATAIQHNLTVVSRNAKDFAGVPVQTLNPWAA
jgi:predicted nucleic acid-binding protein